MIQRRLLWITCGLIAIATLVPGCFGGGGGGSSSGGAGADPALDHFEMTIASPQTVGAAFSGTCTITAKDASNNTVTTFDASTDNVTLVASSGGAIVGLGSGNNAVLNRSADFTNGVAILTGALVYTGAPGSMTFTAIGGSSLKVGASSSVVMNPDPPCARVVVASVRGLLGPG